MIRVAGLVVSLAALVGSLVACSDGSGGDAPSQAKSDGGARVIIGQEDAGASPTAPGTNGGTNAGTPGNSTGSGVCKALASAGSGAPTACSDADAGTTDASITLKNGCGEDVELVWVDYACKEVSYQTVAAGSEITQGSYAGHPWRVRLAKGGAVVKDIPRLAVGNTTVTLP